MGAYKQFLASDIIVAPLEVSKGFTFKGKSEFTSSNVGINRFLGQNVTQFNFDPNLDPITGDYYNVVTPGATASLAFTTLPFNIQAASIGSSSFSINNTTFIITGSGTLPINNNNIIYIPSGSSGAALASSIQNHINNSSSLFPGIYNITASAFVANVILNTKTTGYINNYNYFISGSTTTYFTGGTNDIVTGSYEYQRLIYDSIKQLYYSNYQTSIYGDPVSRPILIPGRDSEGDRYVGLSSNQAYDNYLQSNLTYPRFFPTGSNALIGVISIPNTLFGDYIEPNSFLLQTPSGSYTDDGEGNIISGSQIVGNIIYPHGIIVLIGDEEIYASNSISPSVGAIYGSATYASNIYGPSTPPNAAFNDWFEGLLGAISSNNVTCSFSSSYTIYETQYKCTIRENEFNSTLNPSAMSGSYNTGSNSGILSDNLTGSYFDPYITTIGLYDEQQNLLAIGKLAQPLPSSPTTDTTILINLDR
jgi:hypothetical protein